MAVSKGYQGHEDNTEKTGNLCIALTQNLRHFLKSKCNQTR